jgi:hypothetical protein
LQLKEVTDQQISLYLNRLFKTIRCCEAEADKHLTGIENEMFHALKNRFLHQQLNRHRRELRRVLDEKRGGLTGGVY